VHRLTTIKVQMMYFNSWSGLLPLRGMFLVLCTASPIFCDRFYFARGCTWWKRWSQNSI